MNDWHFEQYEKVNNGQLPILSYTLQLNFQSSSCIKYYLQTCLILVLMLPKLYECKLDNNSRNFCFYHILENLTVFEKFTNSLGVPNSITKQGFHSFITGLYIERIPRISTASNLTEFIFREVGSWFHQVTLP